MGDDWPTDECLNKVRYAALPKISDDVRAPTCSRTTLCLVSADPGAAAVSCVGFMVRLENKVDVTVNGSPLTAAHCRPSAFGDLIAGETKVDTTVRDASEVVPAEDTVIAVGPDLERALPSLTAAVRKHLFPGRDGHIKLRLHKVAVYGPRGLFKRHVDTPRPGVLGTVVVESSRGLVLHDPYTGATVSADLTHAHQTTAFAFFSHVPHEVLPNPHMSGSRVSVVYDIVDGGSEYDGEGADGPPPRAYPKVVRIGQVDKGALVAWVDECLAPETRRAPLNVMCSNTYSYAEVAAGLLKGCDVDMRDLVLQRLPPGTAVEVRPVVHHVAKADYNPDDAAVYEAKHAVRFPTMRCVYSARPQDIQAALDRPWSDGNERYDGSAVGPVFLHPGLASGKHLTSNTDQIEYIGNEAFGTYFEMKYWRAMLVFHAYTVAPTIRPLQALLDAMPVAGDAVGALAADLLELQQRALEIAVAHGVALRMDLNGHPAVVYGGKTVVR